MIEELQKKSMKSNLNINIGKTKIITDICIKDDKQITLNNKIEKTKGFVYLGQMIETNRNIGMKINRRILQDWRQFGKLNQIFKADIQICLKTKTCDQWVLLEMSYRSETWNTT